MKLFYIITLLVLAFYAGAQTMPPAPVALTNTVSTNKTQAQLQAEYQAWTNKVAAEQATNKALVVVSQLPVVTNHPVTVAWNVASPLTNQPAVLLQVSYDLKRWRDLGFFSDSAGAYTFVDTNGGSHRFYRAMAVGSFQTITNLSVTNTATN